MRGSKDKKKFHKKFGGSRNMSEALLLSLIHKLEIAETAETYKMNMEWLVKEMREIVDIVKDKKLKEERSLNFLVSDLVDVADDAIDLFKNHIHMSSASIHNSMGEIKKQMLKLEDGESNMTSSENVDDNYVVGLEGDVEFLIRKRIIGRGGISLYYYFVKTLLIKGMSGIGKTTLAREIYNHASVIQHFDTRAWVSDSTSMKELLIKLIQQVEDPHTSSLLENMDNQSLRDMIRQHLRGKRFLIILDDLPKKMPLKSLMNAFPQQDDGSRVLLTSHTTPIDIEVFSENVYKMEPLDSKKSWQLFLKTINHGNRLMGEHQFPMDLEHMGKQMLRKCGGLPLAIKVVGKQLAEKKLSGGSEWEQLLESVDFGPILKLLEPFYLQLDPERQLCFMCMAFFKENTTLRKEKLTQIWVAGGVLQSSEDQCEKYLEDLVNESVIDVNDKGTKYRMNVVLHMLSIQKAEEKLGFEILRNNGNNRPSESPRHHRVIICSRDKFNYSTDQDKHLVSLFFHGGGYLDTSPSYWKSFEQLKILDLEDFGLKFLPETICTLMELRYLGLRNNYIKELPESLGCLEKLEVLDIAQNFMLELPDVIWELHSLRHLYMSNLIYRKPLKIDTLQDLETLTYVSVDNWTYELSDLVMLTELWRLGIEEVDENSDVSKLFASLAEMYCLKHLILRGYRFRSMPCLDELRILYGLKTLKLDGLLARLPTSFPPELESLTLINSCLDEDPMPLLGEKLPELKYLKLRNAYTGQQMVILGDGFPGLEKLCIEELWNLRNVRYVKNAMGNWLMKLEIHDCPYLDTLPEEIVSMTNLRELKMVTTKSIATKMKNSHLTSKIATANINPMS
ncbi:disease resistance RPP8-like protein 3 [Salvia miltiorrhiza]|uniref:disease resistance RPP8-like protein 3 n=1 Tax=Salvia miltiorrhiza TaxID=226208 RepID=UPI0025AC8C3E|nr:disease resistance RPP8-like protein 3 [Salvia miltiorrhiza]